MKILYGDPLQIRDSGATEWMTSANARELEFLSDWLRRDAEARTFADLQALSFWLRARNLNRQIQRYRSFGENRRGRGLVLHFAPGNMPLNFMVSLASSMLAGNTNVVRLPSREHQQQDVLMRAFNDLGNVSVQEQGAPLHSRLVFFRAPHHDAFTEDLSRHANARVIWGGDASILEIRRIPSQARCLDVPFANRVSCAIFSGSQVADINESRLRRIASSFFADTYAFDQSACSSPYVIYWLGTERECRKAAQKFWTAVSSLVDERDYDDAHKLLARRAGAMVYAATASLAPNMISYRGVTLLDVASIEQIDCTHPPAYGLFQQVLGLSLQDLLQSLNRHQYQTAVVLGLESSVVNELRASVACPDRIVGVGRATEFDFVWDGYDLPVTLSRKIRVGAMDG